MKSTTLIKVGAAALPLLFANVSAHADNTVGGVLETIGQFETFLEAVEEAGHSDRLAGDGPVSVFAPTDEAIGEIADDDEDFAGRHIVEDAVSGEEDAEVEAVSGDTLTVEVDDDDGTSVNGVGIAVTGMEVDNGYIHVLEGPIAP